MTKNLSLTLAIVLLLSAFGFQSTSNVAKPINVQELTIAQIHAAYKKGTFTSQQLVAAYLERINQFDKQINAITTLNPQAMATAKALDEEYKRTKVLRPLHGIPLIVKDNINTKGLATTAGALALKNFMPETDAFIIDKLVKAGAIIIAKSNMAEWAFAPYHSISSTHGATLNPYNVNHVPAGSSGGTGASVAANFGTIGLGTDTGNSIRGPSSHCAYSKDAITKYSDGKIPKNYTKFLQKNGLKGARIGVLRELSEANPDPEIKALFEKALMDMKAMGATVVDVTVPDFVNLRKNQWCAEFRTDVESFLSTYVKNDTLKTLEDIIRVGTNVKEAADRLVANAKNKGRAVEPAIECLDAYTDVRRVAFRKAIENQMDLLKLDAIVYPSWNNKPAGIDAYLKDYKGDNSQIIAPHTGQPAFTVPMGFTTGNLPAGLQFLGRMYAEPTLIKLTYAYEQATKHRMPPTLKK